VARNEQSGARVYGASLEIMETGEILEAVELRRFTRREYDELVEQGWFEDEPIELLRGMLVKMSPQGADHNGIVDDIMHVFARALPIETFGVRAHSAFAATDDSEPEPDFYVYRKPRPSDSHPTSALLLVEVSRSSLRRDRTVKLSIYAQNGVPEYWIVDLEAREVEVYTQPEGHEYRQLERIQIDGELRPRFDPTIVIAMSSLPWADPIS
jgi:Uma2 family endonuclease